MMWNWVYPTAASSNPACSAYLLGNLLAYGYSYSL